MVKEAGFADASKIIKTFAAQHKRHAEITHELSEKYAPQPVKQSAGKQSVCGVCGFVYEGSLGNAPEDFSCPLCGMQRLH